ncbi:MAG: disulfide isomerase DsbC N-terminal domain-containing protein, partial [Psychromonas sp.]
MATIYSKTGTACLLLLTSFAAISSTDEAATATSVDKINAKMQSLNIPVNAINESEVDGLYEVIANGEIYYVSEDGKYLLHGNIYDLDNQMVNVTGEKKAQISQDRILQNMDKLKSFEKDMIVYQANNEKYVINVFTDPTCGYCQKLHAQIDDYNKLGITIRYLAFPRGGL